MKTMLSQILLITLIIFGQNTDAQIPANDKMEGISSNANSEVKKNIDDFCTVYKEICSLKLNDFAAIRGELTDSLPPSLAYNTTLKMPRSTESYISYYTDFVYVAVFGKFEEFDDAKNEFNRIANLLVPCVEDKMFVPSDNMVNDSYSISNKYSDGYDTEGDFLHIRKIWPNSFYSVILNVKTKLTDNNRRVHYICDNAGSGDAAFDATFGEFLGYAKNNFAPIYGKKYETPFYNTFKEANDTSIRYDSARPLSGVNNLKLTKSLYGEMYLGNDETEATKMLDLWFEKIKKSLGPKYSYYKEIKYDGKQIAFVFGDLATMPDKKNTEVIRLFYNKKDGNPAEFKVSMTISFEEFKF